MNAQNFNDQIIDAMNYTRRQKKKPENFFNENNKTTIRIEIILLKDLCAIRKFN